MTTAAEPKKKKATECTTPEFRVSFPAVFQAKSAAEGQEPKFSITMLFPKTTDITPLKNAVAAAIREKWGDDKTKWPKGMRLPFRDGAEKDYEGYADTTFCTASSKMRPGLVARDMTPIISPEEFYGGCYARATIAAFAYDKAGNKGVSWGLRNIQKIKDGEPFSGRSKPEADFEPIPEPEGGKTGASDLDDIGA